MGVQGNAGAVDQAVFNYGVGLNCQMLGLVAAWTVIFFGIAVKRFRWA